MYPSNPLAIVVSIGSSLCGRDVDIIDPWDGNPTAVFSPDLSPSYLEPMPLASLHPIYSGDDESSSCDDYSSSDEARLETGGRVACKQFWIHQSYFEFHVEDPSSINLMMDWVGVSNPEKSFVNCSFLS
ncbi:hypothetical protein NE237_019206 [Protea cynaroides]|uniref:Uncharacterized protein n=1 Tax=Protea cynaroides TaxID=273540 RepID=A0A9Q0KBE4_9MAGN|nr:hypothetical protein NE237_019206 [Protea cynaroides]